MAITTLKRNVTLKVMECGTCGIAFALPQTLYDACYNDGGYWSCPLGHQRGWEKGNKKARMRELEEELAREQENTLYWQGRKEEVERQLTAQKGQNTRLRKRITNGVCPCCNRTFANVARHMENKHPGWTE